MKFERKHSVLLLGVAAWNVASYATFAKNLAAARSRGEDRPTGYWVAHAGLIVVNFGVAAALGGLGAKTWRASARR
ncbi:MAG: SCO4848 family membrane protein [Nocardioidaceae bacterium]